MKLYRLTVVLSEPSEDNGDKFLAEVPSLPGCRAWGDTAAEAIETLQIVATAFVESYKDHGDALPAEVVAVATEADRPAISEVLIAV